MIRRAFLPTFYDLYQLIIAIIGLAAVNRFLLDYTLVLAVLYSVTTVFAYWIGQGLVSMRQTPPHRSLD